MSGFSSDLEAKMAGPMGQTTRPQSTKPTSSMRSILVARSDVGRALAKAQQLYSDIIGEVSPPSERDGNAKVMSEEVSMRDLLGHIPPMMSEISSMADELEKVISIIREELF